MTSPRGPLGSEGDPSLLTHVKQLLLEIFCNTTAGIGASFQTHGNMNRRMDGHWTDVGISKDSYLDKILLI